MAKVNPFRFSTKYQDDESDMVYYGYRYYSASMGRWLSRDPLRELGFELIAARPKSQTEKLKERILVALEVLRAFNPNWKSAATHQLSRVGFDWWTPNEDGNPYAFVGEDSLDKTDVLGLWQWGWPPWGKKKECCKTQEGDNPAKELLKGAAETLTGTIADGAEDLDPKQLAAASKMLQLIQLAMNAKKACGDMHGLADDCSEFAKHPDLQTCLSCCQGLYNSFPEIGGVAHFACSGLCSVFN